jgi:hypothetical protein
MRAIARKNVTDPRANHSFMTCLLIYGKRYYIHVFTHCTDACVNIRECFDKESWREHIEAPSSDMRCKHLHICFLSFDYYLMLER